MDISILVLAIFFVLVIIGFVTKEYTPKAMGSLLIVLAAILLTMWLIAYLSAV